MQISITVKYVNTTGAGKLRATGAGVNAARRQVTIPYPHSVRSGMKHYNAARELEHKLERLNGWKLRLLSQSEANSVKHYNGVRFVRRLSTTFVYEVFDQTVPTFDNCAAMVSDSLPAGYARS